MKFREKLQKEHPDRIGEVYCGDCEGCPCDYGYEEWNGCPDLQISDADAEKYGSFAICHACWNREVLY